VHITKDVYYSNNYNDDDEDAAAAGDDDDDDDDGDDDNNNNNNHYHNNKLQDYQSPPSITCGYRLHIYQELLQIREKTFEE
jgi:hypothetical protein